MQKHVLSKCVFAPLPRAYFRIFAGCTIQNVTKILVVRVIMICPAR